MSTSFTDYAVGAVIKGDGQVSSLDYHRQGQMLIAGTTNNTLYVIDSLSGQLKKKLFVKTAGLGNVRYTHHEQCILVSSERHTNDIRYLCVYDNRYLRYFKGHTDRVTSLAMSPIDDHFLSSSLDRTVCLWSLELPGPVAKLALPSDTSRPQVAYDSTGVVFAVMAKSTATGQHSVRLYDSRNYQKGPFVDIGPTQRSIEDALARADPDMDPSLVQRALASSWTDLSFSPDGGKVLVNTSSDILLSLDGFRPDVEPVVLCGRGNSSSTLGATFTPDSKYVLAGSEDKQVLVYDFNTGAQVGKLNGEHVAPVSAVMCNPRYDCIATAGINTALWIPNTQYR